jgi:hypothetical protein
MRSTALFLLPALLAAQVATIEVADTAGLRRFGYPVRARVKTSVAPESLRLIVGGKAVDAQFTPMGGGEIEVDFAISLGPYEKRRLTVEPGTPRTISAPMSVGETTSSYAVHYPGGLTFHVPKDLRGLFRSVETPAVQYVRPESGGLVLGGREGGTPAVAAVSRIVKSGPLACALRFECAQQVGKRAVQSVVEMEFPRSKSWAEVRWTVDDPDAVVGDLGADVNLSVEGQPLTFDFGAGTMVYGTLKGGQSARMQTTSSGWNIDLNGEAYAAARDQRPEGWAHVMDSRRATAVAVAGFDHPESTIEIASGGRLRIERKRLEGRVKSLAFWLHFVPMPVQVGAATSPQSMMRPLSVRVE